MEGENRKQLREILTQDESDDDDDNDDKLDRVRNKRRLATINTGNVSFSYLAYYLPFVVADCAIQFQIAANVVLFDNPNHTELSSKFMSAYDQYDKLIDNTIKQALVELKTHNVKTLLGVILGGLIAVRLSICASIPFFVVRPRVPYYMCLFYLCISCGKPTSRKNWKNVLMQCLIWLRKFFCCLVSMVFRNSMLLCYIARHAYYDANECL
jgi:hypothetical protein